MGMYDEDEIHNYVEAPNKRTRLEELEYWWDWSTESRYARYWIAEEMANFIWQSGKHYNRCFAELRQILKKEWFRNAET